MLWRLSSDPRWTWLCQKSNIGAKLITCWQFSSTALSRTFHGHQTPYWLTFRSIHFEEPFILLLDLENLKISISVLTEPRMQSTALNTCDKASCVPLTQLLSQQALVLTDFSDGIFKGSAGTLSSSRAGQKGRELLKLMDS